jgi:hypothetical protein
VRSATTPRREALAATGFETVHLGLRPGDKRGQAIDTVADRNHRLWLRLRLKRRLRTMIALVILARLLILLLAWLVRWLRFPLLIPLGIARHKRLLLDRDEARFGAEIRKALVLVVAVLRGHFIFGARLRLVLAKLFLSSRDQPEIMLGMLIIIFRCYRIARAPRVARQLNVFFRNVGCGAANLDVGSVGLENPGHRVLPTPVIIITIAVIIVIVVPVTHSLVVVILTVSHVLPFYRSKIAVVIVAALDAGCVARSRIAMQSNSASILSYVAFNKDALPTRQRIKPAGPQSFSLPKQAQVFSREFQAQYQAFVRFAVVGSAALSAIALDMTCLLEPFSRVNSR